MIVQHCSIVFLLLGCIAMHINQSGIFRVVQVIKSLQDPLEVGNNLTRIIDVACCYRCSVVSVCLSVGHGCEVCKNG